MQRKHNKELVPYAKLLRKEMTKEERHLWYDGLKKLPVTVHRQKVLGNYIVDFYIASAKLVIELDGSQHYTADGKCYDRIRTDVLERYGLSVLRFSNQEIDAYFEAVCMLIDQHVKQRNIRKELSK